MRSHELLSLVPTTDELLALPASVPLWPVAGRALGLGRSKTYDCLARGELPFPVLRLGSRYRVNRADLLRALSIPDRDGAPAA